MFCARRRARRARGAPRNKDNWRSAPNDEVLEAAAPGLCRLGGTASELDVTYFAATLAGLQKKLLQHEVKRAQGFEGLEGEISGGGLAIRRF